MKTIILAAGEGKRLRPHTDNSPKCMVKLDGVALLVYQLKTLKSLGVDDITIVGGYQFEKLREFNCPIIVNQDYEITNMVYSLMKAKEILLSGEDVLVCYSDIIYGPKMIQQILEKRNEERVLLPSNTKWSSLWSKRFVDPLDDVETFSYDESDDLIDLGKKPTSLLEIQGQFMGVIYFPKVVAKEIVSLFDLLNLLSESKVYDGKNKNNMYMTTLVRIINNSISKVKVLHCEGDWLEVDTCKDLELYEDLILTNKIYEYYNLPEKSIFK